jgi:hypothetical protein
MSAPNQAGSCLLAGLCATLMLSACSPDRRPVTDDLVLAGEEVDDMIEAVELVDDGTTGEMLRVRPLSCANDTEARRSVTVGPADLPQELEVNGHTLLIPRGAITGSQPVTLEMVHQRDPSELRVEVRASPSVANFPVPLEIALSYATCSTAGIDMDRVVVTKDRRIWHASSHANQRVRARLPHLSEYSLAAP